MNTSRQPIRTARPTADRGERAYLSIIGWPDGMTEADRVEALVAAAGLDPYNARLAARRATPHVACLVDADLAEPITDTLAARGVHAFAPCRATMAAVPEAEPVRRFGPAADRPGTIAAELPNVEHTGRHDQPKPRAVGIHGSNVIAIVRTTLATTKTTGSGGGGGNPLRAVGMTVAFGIEGALVAAAADAAEAGANTSSRTTTREIVELHAAGHKLAADRRLRCDIRKSPPTSQADRLRGHGERADTAAHALAKLCPRAVVDLSFRDFRCPPDVLRTTWHGGETNAIKTACDAAAFEFYSRWAHLLYRRMLGLGAC